MTDKPAINYAGADTPAFPHIAEFFDRTPDGGIIAKQITSGGMTLHQHAAITLRVPDSGLPWMDAMITEARRLDFAGQLAVGFVARVPYGSLPADSVLATQAMQVADALTAAAKETKP